MPCRVAWEAIELEDQPVLTIFGGSKPAAGEPAYEQAEALGRLAAQSGWVIATGGYSGTMEAASKGAVEAGGEAIGVTCQQIEEWRPLGPNPWLTREIRCQGLRDRLERLVDIGQAAIALPGGVGTLAEISLTWSWLQTGVIAPKPLVLVGEGWKSMLETMQFSQADYVDHADFERLAFAASVESAWRIVLAGVDRASH
jgi:hypothetical protein